MLPGGRVAADRGQRIDGSTLPNTTRRRRPVTGAGKTAQNEFDKRSHCRRRRRFTFGSAPGDCRRSKVSVFAVTTPETRTPEPVHQAQPATIAHQALPQSVEQLSPNNMRRPPSPAGLAPLNQNGARPRSRKAG